MSGIFGICQPGRTIAQREVDSMRCALALADETDSTFVGGGSAYLGVARRWAWQQAAEVGGIYVAADAELYNVPELQALVEPSQADGEPNVAELIALLYRKYGPQFVERMHGVFAIAIWDKNANRLMLVLDRLGVNSLYWRQEPDRLLFGSRIGAVRAVQTGSPTVSPSALMQYLLFSAVSAPMTIYSGIERMLPGHYLVFENGRVRQTCYWDIDYTERENLSEREWSDEVREGLRSAVQLHLLGRESTSTGAYLSGGTDSSSVVAFMSEKFREPQTFSIFFEEQRWNEIGYARITAEHFKAKHRELCVRPSDAWDAIPKIVSYYDEPFANTSAIGAYLCARMARKHGVTALLAGDGGDELFGGNSRYATDKYFAAYHKIPSWIRRGLIEPVTRAMPVNESKWTLPKRYVRRANIPLPNRVFSYNVFLSIPKGDIFDRDFLSQAPSEEWMSVAEGHFRTAKATTDLNRLLYVDMKMILSDNDLRKVLGTAELGGVRAVFPLLDYKLVELAASLPSRLKVKGFEKRYIFKKAMKGILPEAILTKTKHGFGVPVALWLSQDKRFDSLVNDLLTDSRTRERGYFQPTFLDRLRRLSRGPDAHYYGEVLWYLVALELWHREHLEAAPRSVEVG